MRHLGANRCTRLVGPPAHRFGLCRRPGDRPRLAPDPPVHALRRRGGRPGGQAPHRALAPEPHAARGPGTRGAHAPRADHGALGHGSRGLLRPALRVRGPGPAGDGERDRGQDRPDERHRAQLQRLQRGARHRAVHRRRADRDGGTGGVLLPQRGELSRRGGGAAAHAGGAVRPARAGAGASARCGKASGTSSATAGPGR